MKTVRVSRIRAALLIVVFLVASQKGFALSTGTLEIASGKVAETSGPQLESSLPDPLAKRATPWASIMPLLFLVAVALAALWLGRRRRIEPEDESPRVGEGPKILTVLGIGRRRRPPGFYEDIRRRETMLENLEERGPRRSRPRVVELPVAEDRSTEGDG